jgi:hypothetical protein
VDFYRLAPPGKLMKAGLHVSLLYAFVVRLYMGATWSSASAEADVISDSENARRINSFMLEQAAPHCHRPLLHMHQTLL